MSLRAAIALSLAVVSAEPVLAGPPAAQPGGEKASSKPAVYSDKPFAEAVAATKGTGKIAIVKATASWCPPCKLMDRTTFVDDRIVKWFGTEGNGLVIDFDVDENRQLAQELRIRAMPTLIAFKDGQEFDRVVGYQNADAMLGWLDRLKANRAAGDGLTVKIEKDAAAPAAAEPAPAKSMNKEDVERRLEIARNLYNDTLLDHATEEFVWLWHNMAKVAPETSAVRRSFFIQDLSRIIADHAPAAEKFAAIRDEAGKLAGVDAAAPGNLEALADWTALNIALRENDRTLAWFDRVKGDKAWSAAIRRVRYNVDRLLEENGRLADLASLAENPVERIRQDHELSQMGREVPGVDQQQRDEIARVADRRFRSKAATLYTGLLLGGREAEAAAVAAEATKLDPSGAMKVALVQKASVNNAAKPEHLVWLDEARQAGEDVTALRTQVEGQVRK